jgi:hypothetical protein
LKVLLILLNSCVKNSMSAEFTCFSALEIFRVLHVPMQMVRFTFSQI